MSSKVLVTGGSGYLGTQLIAALLRDGRDVRATVRSLDAEEAVRAAVRRGGVDDTGIELVAADLSSDDGWPAALEGVEEVHHVASPIPSAQPKDPDELIVPAREGTGRGLQAVGPVAGGSAARVRNTCGRDRRRRARSLAWQPPQRPRRPVAGRPSRGANRRQLSAPPSFAPA